MRRSTTVLLVLAILVAGVYYLLNRRQNALDASPTSVPTSDVTYLFSSTDGAPTSIQMASKTGETVELERDANNAWVLKQPIEAKADQGSSEASASQITAIPIIDQVSTDVTPKDVGLDAPDYTLTVKFDSGVERIAQIGVVTPTGNGYYVDINDKIVIVSKSGIDALTGLLTNPPYAETLTPSPTASITPTETDTPLPPSPTPVISETVTPTP